MSTNVTLDDRSARIIYSGGTWYLAGTTNENIYNGTVHSQAICPAAITFQFQGTQVAVYGVLWGADGDPPPVSQYRIDTGDWTTFTPTLTEDEEDQVLMYQSPVMTAALYTLTVNITTCSGNAPYFIDYIQYTTDTSTSVSRSQSTTAGSQTTSPASTPSSSNSQTQQSSQSSMSSVSNVLQSTTIASLTRTASSTGSAGLSSSTILPANDAVSHSHTGAIVGGVVGGVGGLMMIALAIWYFCRRRRNSLPAPSPFSPPDMADAAPNAGSGASYMAPAAAQSQRTLSPLRYPESIISPRPISPVVMQSEYSSASDSADRRNDSPQPGRLSYGESRTQLLGGSPSPGPASTIGALAAATSTGASLSSPETANTNFTGNSSHFANTSTSPSSSTSAARPTAGEGGGRKAVYTPQPVIPTQLADSGVRFGPPPSPLGQEGWGSGSSVAPTEVPPAYTPN